MRVTSSGGGAAASTDELALSRMIPFCLIPLIAASQANTAYTSVSVVDTSLRIRLWRIGGVTYRAGAQNLRRPTRAPSSVRVNTDPERPTRTSLTPLALPLVLRRPFSGLDSFVRHVLPTVRFFREATAVSSLPGWPTSCGCRSAQRENRVGADTEHHLAGVSPLRLFPIAAQVSR